VKVILNKLAILIFFLLHVSACATTTICHEGGREVDKEQGNACYQSVDKRLDLLDLKCLFTELAQGICCDVSQPVGCSGTDSGMCGKGKAVLVTDFVELDTLKPGSAGIVMGEVMRSALSSVCGYEIQQAELARYFSLSDKGLRVLTRDNESIRQDGINKDFIVGTYSYSPEKLMIFVKKFDLATGKIIRMNSKEIDFSCSNNRINYRIH